MPEESWIAAEQAVNVVGRDGKTVVGRLQAGATQRTIGSNEHWFMIRLPDGSTGFVPRTQARSVAGPPPTPPVQPTPQPTPPPTPPSPRPTPVPAAPPGQPPTQPPVAATSGGGGNARSWIIAAAVAVVLIVVVAAGAYYFLRDDSLVMAEGEVFLEPANDPGPEVFTTTLAVPDAPDIVRVAPVVATVTTAETTTSMSVDGASGPSDSGAALPAVSGTEPGLYGGTQDASRCDPDQMVVFLNNNPDKAQAWVGGINADPAFRWSGGTGLSVSDIPVFMAELTPVTLVADTRVTNNGYRDGVSTPRQAVLQAGTSVIVDSFGVPRAKCNCGNPLAPPEAQATSVAYTGKKWDDFKPEATVVVQSAPAPMSDIKLVDVFTGELIERPIGTTGASDVPTGVFVSDPLVSSAATTTSTSIIAAPTTTTTTNAPTTTAPTTTAPTTTTTAAPSVLTSGDFCIAFAEYAQIDQQYYDQHEDPESIPEYRAFVLAALSDLADIAPTSIKADWEWYRDAYRRNPQYFSGELSPEVEERFGRIVQHLDTDCDLGLFEE